MRRPGTVNVYETILRRFGDWLGNHDPTVRSVADVRRQHIEAYKQAVAEMKIGDHISALRPSRLGDKRGQPISRNHQIRCISCVRAFFEMIETLEYPERPGRRLFIRGNIASRDHELPRFIPDAEWHRFVSTAQTLTPELVEQHRLPRPYERSRAILAVLLECGLRAGELSRLDAGCVIAAQDAATGAITHWLRVPTGKLHNDRMIPVRPSLVETLDIWMRCRGPQPLLRDERTEKMQDFLFTWRGSSPTPDSLNSLIARISQIAGVPRATSHQFRHTLAVQWRKNGMKIETISRMLGHYVGDRGQGAVDNWSREAFSWSLASGPSKMCCRPTRPLAAASSHWRLSVGRNSVVVWKKLQDSRIDSKWQSSPTGRAQWPLPSIRRCISRRSLSISHPLASAGSCLGLVVERFNRF